METKILLAFCLLNLQIYFSIQHPAIESSLEDKLLEKFATTINKSECDIRIIMKPGQLPIQIKSPNYPREYPPNLICKWIILGPFGYRLKITFDSFHLQYAQFCNTDFLEITDVLGSNLYCGSKSPPDGVYWSIGSKLQLLFVTDYAWQFKGFSLKIEILKVYCGDIIFNSAVGTIISPGYPHKYPNNMLCIWTLESTEGHVQLGCERPFLLETSFLCQHDVLLINDKGNDDMHDSLRFCGSNHPRNILSKSNKMHIFFYSDYDNNYPGFLCHYKMNTSLQDEPDYSSFRKGEAKCECGRDVTPQFRVYGANRTKHDFPLVALVYNDGTVFCGGTMITTQYVLTAAHCLHRETTNSFKVIVEGYGSPEHQTKNFLHVKRLIIHEKYGSKDFDIALLKIPDYYGRMEHAFIACLPPKDLDLPVNSTGEVRGWGENYLEGDDRLYHAVISIVDNSSCLDNFKAFSYRQFCAGTPEKGVGRGDSGGPFYVTVNGRLTIAGLVSYGKRYNARNYPAVFTKISEMVDWIQENAKTSCMVQPS